MIDSRWALPCCQWPFKGCNSNKGQGALNVIFCCQTLKLLSPRPQASASWMWVYVFIPRGMTHWKLLVHFKIVVRGKKLWSRKDLVLLLILPLTSFVNCGMHVASPSFSILNYKPQPIICSLPISQGCGNQRANLHKTF